MICTKLVNFEINNKSALIEWSYDDTDVTDDQLQISSLGFILPEYLTTGLTEEEYSDAIDRVCAGIQAAIIELSGLTS